jgi:Ca2+-binding RTX toxin-like protein
MLLSGVVLAKTIKGGSGNDTLPGTNSGDYIKGNGGNDAIDGKEGEDHLYGGKGKDSLRGGRGFDRIWGDAGFDTAYGNQGYDRLYAEDPVQGPKGPIQAAKIKANRKPDRLLGGRGNDTFRARNGKRDIIRGGPGRDKAYVDRVDDVQGVEKEVVPGGGGPQPKKQCQDGKDNDGDQQIDMQDPGCAKATDDTENIPPVAHPNSETINKGETATENVITGGTDDEDADDDISSLSVASFDAKSAKGGTVTQSQSDEDILEYTPKTAGFVGVDSFTYKATDGDAESNSATVTINVCDDTNPSNPNQPDACQGP